MHNPVVFHAERELFRSGFTTLRFNFRGVGDSQGEYDECRGEVEDLAAAASWLRGVALGLPLFLVGYSFGSVCSIRLAVNDDTVKAVIGIGLPARIFELDDVKRLGRPLTIVQGSEDEFGLARRGSRTALAGAAGGAPDRDPGSLPPLPRPGPGSGRRGGRSRRPHPPGAGRRAGTLTRPHPFARSAPLNILISMMEVRTLSSSKHRSLFAIALVLVLVSVACGPRQAPETTPSAGRPGGGIRTAGPHGPFPGGVVRRAGLRAHALRGRHRPHRRGRGGARRGDDRRIDRPDPRSRPRSARRRRVATWRPSSRLSTTCSTSNRSSSSSRPTRSRNSRPRRRKTSVASQAPRPSSPRCGSRANRSRCCAAPI